MKAPVEGMLLDDLKTHKVQISFQKKNTTEASVTIQIEEADYEDSVSKKVGDYRKKASIKGFRPGGVPTKIIQQMYGGSIRMEVVGTLLAESLVQYLKKHEIRPLGEPMPVLEKVEAIDWQSQRDFEVEYTIGLASPFVCKISKDMHVTTYQVSQVAEQTVDALVEQLRKDHGKIEVVTKSSANDIVFGDLHYSLQHFKVNTQVAVGEVAEKVREVFIDLSPQDEVVFDVRQVLKTGMRLPAVPDSMHETMLKLGGSAKFTVEKIHRLSPAAVAQDLFDKTFGQTGISSEQDFRDKLRAQIVQKKQREADVRLEQAIQATLLKEAAIVLPDAFLKAWLESKNQLSKEAIEIYYPQYAKGLQWRLLVDALGEDYDIQVTHEEVMDEIRHRFQGILEGAGTAQRVSGENMTQLAQDFMRQDNGEHYSKVRANVYARKLINLIKDQITIIAKEISVEEFDNLASE